MTTPSAHGAARQNLPRFVSVDVAAKMISVNPKTIRRMISSGELRGYRVKKRLIRIDSEQVMSLLRPIQSAAIDGTSSAPASDG